MWSQYDENLSINPFFKTIYENHSDIVEEATLRQWIICIPRIGTIDHPTISNDIILDHIIIPTKNDEPFYTLSKKQICVCNKQISIYSSCEGSNTVDILFEETYYVNNNSKFILWCVDRPLFLQSHCCDLNYNKNLLSIHDCIDFLWCESLNHDILDCLKCLVYNYSLNHTFELESVQTQKELIGVLFSQSLQQCFKYPVIKEKFKEDGTFLEKLKQAVETYMHYCLGRKLIFSINTTTHQKDSSLNHIIKKYSDAEYCDLGIEPNLSTVVLNAKCELNQINSYYTVLDKISCLKKTVGIILESGKYSRQKCITSDDILQILVFLILKLNVNNWFGNLIYIKEFQLSIETADQTSFCISSLEAALEFILTTQFSRKTNVDKVLQPEEMAVNFIETKIKSMNVRKVSDLYSEISVKSPMCHPLCACSKCDNILQQRNTISYIGGISFSETSTSLLIHATVLGKFEVIEFLLHNGVNINYSDFFGKTSLHYAAVKGFQNILLMLINKKAEVNVQDNEKNTPLHLTCLNGHENCVKALLYSSSEVELNIGNSVGDTPLMLASRWGYLDIVKILLENGASVIVKNKINQTVFDVAHNAYIFKLCQRYTKHINVSSNTILEISGVPFVSKPEHRCNHHGIRPKSADQFKRIDVLLKSIEKNDFPLTCFYLGYNNITQTVKSGNCHPLCLCDTCKNEQFDEVDSKKSSLPQINVNMCDNRGYTPLHIAAKFGRTETLRMLLDSGALPNLKTYKTLYTPLHLACMYERIQVIRDLVKCGNCNVDEQDNDGNTSLFYACQKSNIKIAETLLINGADCDIKNIANKSALMVSEENLQYGILGLLKHNSKSKLKREKRTELI